MQVGIHGDLVDFGHSKIEAPDLKVLTGDLVNGGNDRDEVIKRNEQ